MRLSTRRLLDKAFSATGFFSLFLMVAGLTVVIVPIFWRGSQAIIFRGTVERRKYFLEERNRGSTEKLRREFARTEKSRQPLYEILATYEAPSWKFLQETVQSDQVPEQLRRDVRERDLPLRKAITAVRKEIGWSDPGARGRLQKMSKRYETYFEIKDRVRRLLGPFPYDPEPPMTRERYGATRWDKAERYLHDLLYAEKYIMPEGGGFGTRTEVARARQFLHEGVDLADLPAEGRREIQRDRELAGMFPYVKEHLPEMLLPRWTFYWRFFFDPPDTKSGYFFGGIWPSLLGTLYLALGTMVIATPLGVISAIYLTQYAGQGRLISLLRVCISTLAGVPSVVFGLFGLAFFINWLHLSSNLGPGLMWLGITEDVGRGRSVLIGCLTLALLVLPTVIRASEEAIKAVPKTYKEASLSLGATKWQSVVKVILPAALPGIITSIIISMGRAAGETAPILFTAAIAFSGGQAVGLGDVFTTATPALPYSIYMTIGEPSGREIRHAQYGMVFTLISLVLVLNVAAIILRARTSKKLRG
jgi:phosphate transport system permease protein